MRTVAIVGNPNSGKTSLFNSLTGGTQHVGNWPGVTVERRVGKLKQGKGERGPEAEVDVVDLPGVYSLFATCEDEIIARDAILSGKYHLIINIVDAGNLERGLFLTLNLIEMRVPVVLLLNMMDLVEKRNININIPLLREGLGIPVYGTTAVDPEEGPRLFQVLKENLNISEVSLQKVPYPEEIEEIITSWKPRVWDVADELGVDERWICVRLLEGDEGIKAKVINLGLFSQEELEETLRGVQKKLKEDIDLTIAEYKFGFIKGLLQQVIKRNRKLKEFSQIADGVLLNRVLGVPLFFGLMFTLFFLVTTFGGGLSDLFSRGISASFTDIVQPLLERMSAPEWVVVLLVRGIGRGIATVGGFVPIIFLLFFFIALFEDSGYMARAAFVMDRLLRRFGLPAKAFLPVLLGFGCTVPAVLSTRILETKRDRRVTIFALPFISCGAKLPMYVIFASAFFPGRAAVVVFSLYLIGILFALLSAFFVSRAFFGGEASFLVMELPPYHLPRLNLILIHTWVRLRMFLKKAGTVIVLALALMGFFLSLQSDGSLRPREASTSVIANIGKAVTPVFSPMGIKEENWPATVALFAGVFTKEAVIGTLTGLYSQLGYADEEAHEEEEEEEEEGQRKGGTSYLISRGFSNGDGGIASSASAYAYLLFILLFFPCVSTLIVMIKEAGWGITGSSVLFTGVVAWTTATLFYQISVGVPGSLFF